LEYPRNVQNLYLAIFAQNKHVWLTFYQLPFITLQKKLNAK
jgi:hypothetical protein